MTTPMFIGRVVSDTRRKMPDYRRLTLDTGHTITRPHQNCAWLPDMRGHWFRFEPARYSPEVARFERMTFPMLGKQWRGKILECDVAGDSLRIIVGVPDARLVFLAFAPLAQTLGAFAMRQNVQVQSDIARCMVGDRVRIKPRADDAFMADITLFYKKKRRVRKPRLYLVKPLKAVTSSENVSEVTA